MESNIKKIGLINLVIMLLVGLVSFFLARYCNSLAGQVGSFFFGIGFLITAISYFQMRLEESERLEKLEMDELAKSRGSTSLFEGADSETFPARRSREQFERFFVPTAATLIFLLQAAATYWSWSWVKTAPPSTLLQPAVALALYGLFALTLFLLGKYSAGVARLQKQRLLRPGASYILLGAYICFAIAASIAGFEMGLPKSDLYAARALTILLGITAIEPLLNLVFEIYRPRVRGTAPARVVYESRLIGLLGQPEGIISTAAQALDYQFGFKVSETWFYRFLEKALAWLILLQLAVLFFSTSFVFIAPGEEGLLERFGTPLSLAQPLQPGPHLKLPWPMDRIYRFRTREIQTFNVGFAQRAEQDGHPPHEENTILWTVGHEKEEFNLLVASRDRAFTNNISQDRGVPADLLTVDIPVHYQISNLNDYAYNHTNARSLLERIATREVIRYLVSVDIFDMMSRARLQATQELQRRIQSTADELKLGVKIVFIGLQDIHPPTPVAASFENVIGALQENQAKLRQAEGYRSRVVQHAEGDAVKRVEEAKAYSVRVVTAAAARALQFTNQLAAYKASPEVFMQRAYLKAFGHGSTNARKYILLTTNSQEVIQLNLEDKVRPDLLDIPLPAKK